MMGERAKREAFEALHRAEGAFLMPNPWDLGSAKLLIARGAKAIATTSAGLAAALGRVDGKGLVTRDEALAHASALDLAVAEPVSGDFENGFGDTPEAVAETVRRAVELGLAGCSIEDATGSLSTPAYPADLALRRIEAAVAAARNADGPFQLTARADGVMLGAYDAAEAIQRLQSFEAAGADVLYAPMLPDAEALRALCQSVSKPVNALAAGRFVSLSLAEFAELGVRRVSIGSSLARVAHAALLAATERFAEGDLSGLAAGKGGHKFDGFLDGA